MDNTGIRLTRYSHGAGCGCKISPRVLDQMLASDQVMAADPRLLVGNDSRDDAAVYQLNDRDCLISTTDFFMPVVDDPFDFGRIAATNAISDIYAMGGQPVMAIAILGWPVDKLPPEVARQVIEGARSVCADAGISLAGGHSIDAPEPIFGLAVSGLVSREHLKRNDTATVGCELYLTKPLGVGILTTAEKKGLLQDEHRYLARDAMVKLNTIGAELGKIPGVQAMTDVTGFGLLGHLLEICEGSGVDAEIHIDRIPAFEPVADYLDQGCAPGGCQRNFESYGHKVTPLEDTPRQLLCDPQTSGGLLVAVAPEAREQVSDLLRAAGLPFEAIGILVPVAGDHRIRVLRP